MKRMLLVCLASLMPLTAAASDLLEVYRRALANDAEFAAAQADLLAGQERVVQGRAGLLPEIGLSANTSRTTADPSGLPSDSYNSNSWRVQLTQPLFRMQNFIAAKQGALQTDL